MEAQGAAPLKIILGDMSGRDGTNQGSRQPTSIGGRAVQWRSKIFMLKKNFIQGVLVGGAHAKPFPFFPRAFVRGHAGLLFLLRQGPPLIDPGSW